MKKVPLRKCLATNAVYPKEELFRVVLTPDNKVLLDITGKLNGRGAYIHKDKNAIDLAIKSKCLERALGVKISEDVYKKMMFYIK